MRDRRELRSFGLVMLVIATVSATALVSSCGSGGSGGGNDGTICNQCGDSDGLCVDTQEVTGGDRPGFCGTTDPCTVELRCLRKLDSAQRRCFPADPATNALDLSYRCDGSRPNPSVAPTTTATPTPTRTPSPTLTPSATAITPTPTLTALSPTPEATASEPALIDVTINIVADVDENNDLPGSFTGTVTYPPTKGNFLDSGAIDCTADEDAATVTDNGTGTLTITFSGDSNGVTSVITSCSFHQAADKTLTDGDLVESVTNGLIITIDPLS